MRISLDTETTGKDFAHGAMPFLVTTCSDSGLLRYWEWEVDPLTRRPNIPQADLANIAEYINAAELIYLHNSKFDAWALATVGIKLPWPKVRDTLIAAHLLASNHSHTLTWCCVEYLGEDIEPYELRVKDVTRRCRDIVKRDMPHWKVADEGVPGLPSVKAGTTRDEDKPWKNDMWLPAALANYMVTNGMCHEQEIPEEWLSACAKYANADSRYTLIVGLEMERLIQQRGYWKQYLHRLKLPRCACEMEQYGITAIGHNTISAATEYETHIVEANKVLTEIAAEFGHKLVLAKGNALNDNMRDFFYGSTEQQCFSCGYTKRVKHWNREQANGYSICPKCAKRKKNPISAPMITSTRQNLDLPVKLSKTTGNATLNQEAIDEYIQTLDDGAALDFMEILADKRLYDTALGFLNAYQRFWVPVTGHPGYYRIHASFNPTATDHLRWSSNSPNMQNVSGESKELSNRMCFGPLPNREWWRFDFKSIERRIPVYECGEPKMLEVFERPDEGPYWGSLYYLTASVLYPNEFWPRAEYPPDSEFSFKKCEPRLYKRSKFFDLARQYGCGPVKGDLLSGVRKSFSLVENEFPLMAALQQQYLDFANRYGYVETLPDRTIDPDRGYPILASRTEDGRVLSTTPFNYHISGTACQVKNLALVGCADMCAWWRGTGFDAHLVLEVHDELLFDFPRGKSMETNLPRALELKALMEQAGMNLVPSIPTPVSMEYHIDSWENGVGVV
jgi:hypothetical protein